jgi:hypothetical protein
MALSTTEFRDDTALSQRQLDLGSDHLALHLFTTRILATAQRMSATDGSVVVDLASSVATKYSVGLSIDVSFLSDLAGQIDRLAALDPTLPSWAPAARNLLPWPTL